MRAPRVLSRYYSGGLRHPWAACFNRAGPDSLVVPGAYLEVVIERAA